MRDRIRIHDRRFGIWGQWMNQWKNQCGEWIMLFPLLCLHCVAWSWWRQASQRSCETRVFATSQALVCHDETPRRDAIAIVSDCGVWPIKILGKSRWRKSNRRLNNVHNKHKSLHFTKHFKPPSHYITYISCSSGHQTLFICFNLVIRPWSMELQLCPRSFSLPSAVISALTQEPIRRNTRTD